MMDLVIHLPRTPRRHDAVWVIVDQLTKSTHFLTVRITFTLEEFYRLYIRGIIRVHGVPMSIVLYMDPRLRHFLKSFQKAMGMQWMMSIAFSSVDIWSVREDHTYFRGHTAIMLPRS